MIRNFIVLIAPFFGCLFNTFPHSLFPLSNIKVSLVGLGLHHLMEQAPLSTSTFWSGASTSLSGLPTTRTKHEWHRQLRPPAGATMFKSMKMLGQKVGRAFPWLCPCPGCGYQCTVCSCRVRVNSSVRHTATSGTSSTTRRPSAPRWSIHQWRMARPMRPSREAAQWSWGTLSPSCGISKKRSWRCRCGLLSQRTKAKDPETQTDWWARPLLICLLLLTYPRRKLQSAVRNTSAVPN